MSQASSSLRFSFASMLTGTAVLSFVLYATVQPSVWAASLGFSVALGVLVIALIRAFASREHRRYWLAFSLAGFAYLGLLYLPVVDERIGAQLITTHGFAGTEGLLYNESRDRSGDLLRPIMSQRWLAASFANDHVSLRSRQLSTSNSVSVMLPQETWAARAFHSAVAILCGLIAGRVATHPFRH